MRKFLSLAVMCSLAFPAMAFGQEIRAEEEMKELEKAEEAQETAEEAPTEPEKLVTPVQKPEGVPVAPKRQAELGFGRGDGSFINGLTYLAMASAYYRIGGYIGEGVRAGSYNNLLDDGVVLDPVTGDPVPELAGAPLGYPYSNYNGFGLNFVGGSIAYYGQRFGVTVDLRFGEGANLLTPLVPVKQGFATWIAKKGELVIDLGFFDTIFGAEVADEWENANYSRGALYFLRQPFNHMGARMSAKLADRVAFTFMTTNGGVLGGQPIDDNETPTLSWQFGFDNAEENIGLFFGALHGASGIDGNKAWEHLFDIVFNANAGLFTLIYNGDFQVNPYTTNTNTGSRDLSFLYGNSLAMIFDVSDSKGGSSRAAAYEAHLHRRRHHRRPRGFLWRQHDRHGRRRLRRPRYGNADPAHQAGAVPRDQPRGSWRMGDSLGLPLAGGSSGRRYRGPRPGQEVQLRGDHRNDGLHRQLVSSSKG